MAEQSLFLASSAFYDFGGAWNNLDDFSLDTLHGGQGGGVPFGWHVTFQLHRVTPKKM